MPGIGFTGRALTAAASWCEGCSRLCCASGQLWKEEGTARARGVLLGQPCSVLLGHFPLGIPPGNPRNHQPLLGSWTWEGLLSLWLIDEISQLSSGSHQRLGGASGAQVGAAFPGGSAGVTLQDLTPLSPLLGAAVPPFLCSERAKRSSFGVCGPQDSQLWAGRDIHLGFTEYSEFEGTSKDH